MSTIYGFVVLPMSAGVGGEAGAVCPTGVLCLLLMQCLYKSL